MDSHHHRRNALCERSQIAGQRAEAAARQAGYGRGSTPICGFRFIQAMDNTVVTPPTTGSAECDASGMWRDGRNPLP